MDYRFEEIQNVKFVCYDVDHPNQALEKQDFIGEIVSNELGIKEESKAQIRRRVT
jgi:hypothetical protein